MAALIPKTPHSIGKEAALCEAVNRLILAGFAQSSSANHLIYLSRRAGWRITAEEEKEGKAIDKLWSTERVVTSCVNTEESEQSEWRIMLPTLMIHEFH